MRRWFMGGMLSVTVVIAAAVAYTSLALPNSARTVRCSDFRTQPDAQVRFDGDPIAYRQLDADLDRIACEELPAR